VSASANDRTDDLSLLAACRLGDTRAFEQLVLRHQRRLYNTALRISGNEADAAEIVQETFVAAWRKLGDFRGEAQFSTWLTRIAVNLIRSRWQQDKKRRERVVSLDGLNEAGNDTPLQVASEDPSALDLLERSELRTLLEHCIGSLDPGFREVLILRDMREMAYEEVGQILGLREGTVKSRLFRAREAVRDCIARGMRRA